MATYILKRKRFGVTDTATNAVAGTVNTARNVAGSTVSGVGGMIDNGGTKAAAGLAGGLGSLAVAGAPVAGITGGLGMTGGAALGAGLGALAGPLGAFVGGAAGGAIGGGAGALAGGKAVYDIGSGIASSATQATGEAIKGVGNAIKA